MTGPRILHLDIETAPLASYHWSLWKQNIGLNQIKVEWSVLAFCAWWEGDARKDIIYMDTFFQDDMRDDSVLLARLWELLDEADFIVAQNGQRFDAKKIRARLLMNGFPPPSPFKVIDTLLIAKSVFGFTSNKLEWMATYFSTVPKRKHGKFAGFDLWVEFLDGNPAAQKEMRLYNIDDVRSLRQVWLELRPWAIDHPNVAVYYPGDTTRCPKCGSEDITKRGRQYTNTGEYHRYHCGGCGGWSRSRYTINSKEKRQSLLS
jgi:hypothetical protein